MVIMAYFLPDHACTKDVLRELDRFIKGWDLPMILMADFNRTESDGDWDVFPIRAKAPADPRRKLLSKFFCRHSWINLALMSEKRVRKRA
jgi:hypothetical protein